MVLRLGRATNAGVPADQALGSAVAVGRGPAAGRDLQLRGCQRAALRTPEPWRGTEHRGLTLQLHDLPIRGIIDVLPVAVRIGDSPMSEQREVVILSGVRTAIGDYGGSLKDIAPTDLAARVIREAVSRAKIDPQDVGQCVFGNV